MFTASELVDARDWIADCFDDVNVNELSDVQIFNGIRRHYDGGISAFVRSVS
jgi:hypothetical protein